MAKFKIVKKEKNLFEVNVANFIAMATQKGTEHAQTVLLREAKSWLSRQSAGDIFMDVQSWTSENGVVSDWWACSPIEKIFVHIQSVLKHWTENLTSSPEMQEKAYFRLSPCKHKHE